MQRKTPKAIEAEPYNKLAVIYFFVSKKNAVSIANKPNKNKITATTIFKAFSNTSVLLLMAKAMITAPPKSNKIDKINCSQTYLLNKLFI